MKKKEKDNGKITVRTLPKIHTKLKALAKKKGVTLNLLIHDTLAKKVGESTNVLD